MDIGRPTLRTESRELIGMVQYYSNIWPRRSHVFYPLTEASDVPKCRKLPWDDALEDSFKELKHMVSAEILLNYPDWLINFTVHTDASDKQLGSVMRKNNKPINFSIDNKASHIVTTPQQRSKFSL